MYVPLALLALPLFAAAQSSNQQSSSQSQQQSSQSQQSSSSAATSNASPIVTVITSTSLSTFPTIGSDRAGSTGTSTFVFTTTQTLTPSAAANNTAASNSSTASSSSSKRTTSSNLPTAPSDISAGGGTNGAPFPGQTGVGGAYGPNDGYIAAASSLRRNALLVGVAGFALGGALVIL